MTHKGMITRRGALGIMGGAAAIGATLSHPILAQGADALNFGVQNNFSGAVGIVWARLKMYESEGLNVDLRYFPDGRTVRDAIISGQSDIGTMNLTPYLVGAASGQFVALAKVFVGDSVGLMVSAKSDIKDVSELRGKKVSITVGSTTGNAFVQKVAPSFGLQKDDYTLVNLPPADQVSALVSGSADAFTGPEPYLTIGESHKIGRVLLRFGKWDPSPNVLVANRDFVEKRPDAAVKMLRSWLKTIELWHNEPDKAAVVLLNVFKEAGYKDLDTEMVKSMMKPLRVEPELTDDFIDYVKGEAKSMVAAKRLKAEPDWSKVMAPELVEKARAG